MTTLAEHIIVAGAENRPPMLKKSMYDSWESRIRLFIKGKKHGRMMLDSIDNGLLVYPTIEENGQTKPKKYFKLTEAQQLQDDCDVQATNIILHGLPPDVYALLINDMHTIGMTMQQVQVNTKFLNAISSEWSKFVTDVKLAKSMYTTNYDQLYAYLSQHERHGNDIRITRERYPDPLAFLTMLFLCLWKCDIAALAAFTWKSVISSETCQFHSKRNMSALIQAKHVSFNPSETVQFGLSGKQSISQTEAEEAEATRKVHDTHARIETESVSETAKKKSGGRSSKSVVIQDTLSTPNSKPATSKTKLKGVPSLTPEEQEATDIMHGEYGVLISEVNMAYLELRIRSIESIAWIWRIHRNRYGILVKSDHMIALDGDDDVLDVLSFGAKVLVSGGPMTGVSFLDTGVIHFMSGERGISMKILRKVEDNKKNNQDGKDGDVDDEGDDHVSDTQDADDEDVETELHDDDIYKYKIRVCKDKDEEMRDAEVEESDKGDEDITDAAKEEPEKILEAKDDAKKTELPPSSSSLSVSSGFGDQFLKLSSDSSLVSTVKDSADADISSLLDIPIQQETPQTQSPSV
ncbi:hypothetical protein Tco_0381972 [Tanacetum coccineum]